MLLEKNGFEVLEVGCIGKRFTLEYIVQMLSRQQNIDLWKTSLNFLKRHPSFGRFPIRLNLKDNLYLLAKKK
jgi:hypothetical protein